MVNGQPRPVEESKYINKDGFLKTNPLKVGRGSHDKSSAYQQALKQKQNKTKAHGAGGKVVGEAVTPAQRKVFNAERERMMTALNNPNKKLSPTEREAVLARGQRNAAAEVRKDAVSPTGVKSPVHAQAKAYHEYARKESKVS